MSKPRLMDFGEFSHALIDTGDLDPVYIVVDQMEFNPAQLSRWLLAYGCFYHVGVASYMSERVGDAFWNVMGTAAVNEVAAPTGSRWPRASERRHFRGEQAVRAVEENKVLLKDPDRFIDHIRRGAPSMSRVRENVENLRGFGGWASFKFCDLLDRVAGIPVEFTEEQAMYDTPKKGLQVVWDLDHGDETSSYNSRMDWAQKVFKYATDGMKAPPRGDRPLGFAELETCLCKFKSHRAGRYFVGKDILEIFEASEDWASSSHTAARLHEKCHELQLKGWG